MTLPLEMSTIGISSSKPNVETTTPPANNDFLQYAKHQRKNGSTDNEIDESEKPLSPPNPSPSPMKQKLDDEDDDDEEEPTKETGNQSPIENNLDLSDAAPQKDEDSTLHSDPPVTDPSSLPDGKATPPANNNSELCEDNSNLLTGTSCSDNNAKEASVFAKRDLEEEDSVNGKRGLEDEEAVELKKAKLDISLSDDHTNAEPEPPNNADDVSKPPLVPAPCPPQEPDMDNLPQDPIPPHQAKFALNIIKAIKRLRDANPFHHPVDIVKLNIPLYYNYIPRPMDLSTIERKINANAYLDLSELTLDFNLMVSNCIKFNGDNAGISKMAVNIQAHFEKHMLNFPPREILASQLAEDKTTDPNITSKRRATVEAEKSVAAHRPKRTIHPPKLKELPYDVRPRKRKFAAELRFCNQTIKELLSKRHLNYNFPFVAPVDAEALNIPHYHEVIKEPMDLGTILSRLANNQYENGDEFERHIRLVFANCYAFNPEGTEVNMMGHRLEAVFDKKWANRPVPDMNNSDSNLAFSSDDEDIEPEISEAMLSEVPAIRLLENQLIRMQGDLEELKKEHFKKLREQQLARRRKKSKTKRSGSHNKRNGNAGTHGKSSLDRNGHHPPPTPVVTYEMKKQVSEAVPDLLEKKVQAIVKIIKNDVEISNEDEVELDMDQLEPHTVLKLHTFLFGEKAMAAVSHKKKKRYYSSNSIEEMDSLRHQLLLFDKGQELNADRANLMRIEHRQDSSDDDASSESSEEE